MNLVSVAMVVHVVLKISSTEETVGYFIVAAEVCACEAFSVSEDGSNAPTRADVYIDNRKVFL